MTDFKVALAKLDQFAGSITGHAVPQAQQAATAAGKGRVTDVTIFGYLPQSQEVATKWNQAAAARLKDVTTIQSILTAVAAGVGKVKQVYRDVDNDNAGMFPPNK